MDVVVFEDEKWGFLSPLNALKHTSMLRWGTKSLLELVSESVRGGKLALWGRDELGDVSRMSHDVEYNSVHRSSALLINSRARPGHALSKILSRKGPFAAMAKDELVAARFNLSGLKPGVIGRKAVSRVAKASPRLETPPDLLFHGYWDLVETNGLAIAEQATKLGDSLTIPETVKLRGPPSNLRLHSSVEVEDHVSIDTRLGPVVVAEGARIEAFSRIAGPCYIGQKTRILSALVRGGTSIFDECKVGGEVENSIIMAHTNKAHLGYVGDSYVGEWVNLGAGSTFSNLKNTYGNVRTMRKGESIDTGLLKVGPALGDMAKVSIGALVFAGRKVGTGSHVTGLASLDIPPFTYFDGVEGKMIELLLESVIETQRRMKERRGFNLSKQEEELIRFAFSSSADERKAAGVKKGTLT